MDDLEDEDTIQLIEETRSKTIEIFGDVDCKFMPDNMNTEETDTNQGATKTAFIPLSAKMLLPT